MHILSNAFYTRSVYVYILQLDKDFKAYLCRFGAWKRKANGFCKGAAAIARIAPGSAA